MGLKLIEDEKFIAGNGTVYEHNSGVYAQVRSMSMAKGGPLAMTISVFVSEAIAKKLGNPIDQFSITCPVADLPKFFSLSKTELVSLLSSAPDIINVYDILIYFIYNFLPWKDEDGIFINTPITSGDGAIFDISKWEVSQVVPK